MTRIEEIEKKIHNLKAQLQYWEAELERAKTSNADEVEKFNRVPSRVRRKFGNLGELTRFIYGQHSGLGVAGCNPTAYSRKKTPCERLKCIHGLGEQTAEEVLDVLEVPIEKR